VHRGTYENNKNEFDPFKYVPKKKVEIHPFNHEPYVNIWKRLNPYIQALCQKNQEETSRQLELLLRIHDDYFAQQYRAEILTPLVAFDLLIQAKETIPEKTFAALMDETKGALSKVKKQKLIEELFSNKTFESDDTLKDYFKTLINKVFVTLQYSANSSDKLNEFYNNWNSSNEFYSNCEKLEEYMAELNK